jgi:beta-lactamase regulating signal transducer with metallopeptidase domain
MFGWNVSAWYSIFAGVAAKSTVVLALAWLVAAVLRKRSAAARHLVWTGALVAVLALPLLSVSLPALRMRAAALWTPQPDAAFMATAASSAGAGATASTQHDAKAAPFMGSHRPVDWRLWLMLVWLAGFSLAFARTLLAYAAALRLRRLAEPFPGRSLCQTLSRAMGMRRAVEILASGTGNMPMTFGLVRPTILMPAETVEWDEERRRIVLLHELAHVRRGDSATHLLARTALNLYWWNPLAWMAWREFLKERERAADDLVLSAGESASVYAGHLLAVARTLQSAPAIEWATVAMARRSQLEGRLLAILDSGANRAAAGRASVLAAALAAVALVAPLAAVRAQVRPTQAVADDVHAADAAIGAARLQKNYERLDNAATAAAQVHMYDIAYKLQEAALGIRGDVFGGASVESGVGFLKLASLEERQPEKTSHRRRTLSNVRAAPTPPTQAPH